ncbi:hypothetical protein GCM10010255_40480 [Streptomyces coeruleofuscus]|uniref:ATP-dependent DNA ligase family profile domain-containing protein n=1 Tax=Streptomyces coeruleofuscus TaxID=66879 RepID=A0ABN3IEM3_9ACTN
MEGMVRDVDAARADADLTRAHPGLRPGWAAEPKWDGFRALVSVDTGHVVLKARHQTGPRRVPGGCGRHSAAAGRDRAGRRAGRVGGRTARLPAIAEPVAAAWRWGARASEERSAHFVFSAKLSVVSPSIVTTPNFAKNSQRRRMLSHDSVLMALAEIGTSYAPHACRQS